MVLTVLHDTFPTSWNINMNKNDEFMKITLT